jgi:hypothetical protein
VAVNGIFSRHSPHAYRRQGSLRDERNFVPLSRSDFLESVFKASGATGLAPMNRLLLYSFWEVHLVLWYGGEWPKTKIGVALPLLHTQMRRKHAEKSMELADEPVR